MSEVFWWLITSDYFWWLVAGVCVGLALFWCWLAFEAWEEEKQLREWDA